MNLFSNFYSLVPQAEDAHLYPNQPRVSCEEIEHPFLDVVDRSFHSNVRVPGSWGVPTRGKPRYPDSVSFFQAHMTINLTSLRYSICFRVASSDPSRTSRSGPLWILTVFTTTGSFASQVDKAFTPASSMRLIIPGRRLNCWRGRSR